LLDDKLTDTFGLKPKVFRSVVLLVDELVFREHPWQQTRTKPTDERFAADVLEVAKLAKHFCVNFDGNLISKLLRQLLHKNIDFS
jgi:hypothetical protein